MLEYLDTHPLLAPVVALLGLLGVIVLAINQLGRHLKKHDEVLALLDIRVGNIHKDREATRVRKMQNPIVPPPLPPRAPTLNAIDWRDDEAPTEQLSMRDTARYPLGKPPEETNE